MPFGLAERKNQQRKERQKNTSIYVLPQGDSPTNTGTRMPSGSARAKKREKTKLRKYMSGTGKNIV